MAEVQYQLIQPEKIIKSGRAWGVVLPTGEVNQTVVFGQSPTIVGVDNGVVQILSENGSVEDKFFVRAGSAHIADDKCIIISDEIILSTDIDDEFWKNHPQNDDFYLMIAEYLRIHNKH